MLCLLARHTLGVAATLTVAAAMVAPAGAQTTSPVADHGALSVSGNHIVDSHVKPVALAGVSFFWSNTGWGEEKFYNADAVGHFAKDWHVSLVRAAMGADFGGDYLTDPAANQARAETVIDAAIANGIYVLIDWHSHHAEQNPQAAATFFTAMAQKYGTTPNVIYEIYNEPLNTDTWSGGVKPYAETVVAAIRAVDPDNLIVVGSPTWSQDVDIAAADPIKATNIAYTLHFYAGSHKQELRTKANKAMALGVPLFVTEWGTVNANGNGGVDAAETYKWQSYMQAHCLSQANWSVSDKPESASLFKPGASPTGPWSDADLTPSGKLVRDIVMKASTTTCQ